MMHSISIINRSTVRDLEKRMGARLDIRRFRANIVIDGIPAWSEQDMLGKEFQIGGITFRGLWPTSRCAATQADPDTGIRDENITKFLKAEFGHQNLGLYLTAVTSGSMKVGDKVTFKAASDFSPHRAYLADKIEENESVNISDNFFNRLKDEFGLVDEHAKIIAERPLAFDFFVESSTAVQDNKVLAKWMVNDLFGRLKQNAISFDSIPISAIDFGVACNMLELGELRPNLFKRILDEVWDGSSTFKDAIDKYTTDDGADLASLEPICAEIISNNPENVEKFKSGNVKIVGWFVGQAMKKTEGNANPKILHETFHEILLELK
jgi:hypothetical protein